PMLNATNRSLPLTNIQSAQAGGYSVVVTDTSGSITSRVAVLDVDPTFTKITTGPIAANRGNFYSCAWGDFDGDGYVDLVVGPGTGGLKLYRNNGPTNGFAFTQITSGVLSTSANGGSGMGWADYDNDGHLDLFAPNYNGQNLLFRNNADGTFVKTTNAPVTTDGISDSSAWADYNNDGYLDLYVCKTWESRDQPNLFYRNNG